jgi:hypothetical protein
MKEFLKDIFPRIIRYSKTLDDQTILTDKPWVLFSNDSATREVWIFKRNHELIFSRDGIADKGSWEYLSEMESLYIEIGPVKRLINQAFIDDVVLLLRLDGGKEFIALANEQKIDETFRIERYLDKKYNKVITDKSQENDKPQILSAPVELSLNEQIEIERKDLKFVHSVFISLIVINILLITYLLFNNLEFLPGALLFLVAFLISYFIIASSLKRNIKKLKEKDSSGV